MIGTNLARRSPTPCDRRGQKISLRYTVQSPPSSEVGHWNHQQRSLRPLNPQFAVIGKSPGRTHLWPQKTQRIDNDASVGSYLQVRNHPIELHTNDCWLGSILTVHSAGTPTWTLGMETRLLGTRKVKRGNEAVSGLWREVIKVGSCIHVSKRRCVHFKIFNGSI